VSGAKCTATMSVPSGLVPRASAHRTGRWCQRVQLSRPLALLAAAAAVAIVPVPRTWVGQPRPRSRSAVARAVMASPRALDLLERHEGNRADQKGAKYKKRRRRRPEEKEPDDEQDDSAVPELGLPRIKDRTFLVTGSTNGIGRRTVELLCAQNCTVIMHGRKESRLLHWMDQIKRKNRKATIDGFVADLSLMSDVQEFAELVKERHPVIHGVLHNAATIYGDFTGKRVVTWDQHEHSLAVNVLAPFLLTALLLPAVRASGAGRFIFSSSTNMGFGESLDDLQGERAWSGNRQYRFTKLCDAMIAQELHHRYGEAPNLCFHAIDPGTVDTKLMRHGSGWGQGVRKGRHQRISFNGVYPNVRTATASFQSLTEPGFQRESGRNLEGAPSEIEDAEKRARLFDELSELTGAEWPTPQDHALE